MRTVVHTPGTYFVFEPPGPPTPGRPPLGGFADEPLKPVPLRCSNVALLEMPPLPPLISSPDALVMPRRPPGTTAAPAGWPAPPGAPSMPSVPCDPATPMPPTPPRITLLRTTSALLLSRTSKPMLLVD